MEDPRVAWICQKALSSLQCNKEQVDAALLSEGSAAIRTFFTGGAGISLLLFQDKQASQQPAMEHTRLQDVANSTPKSPITNQSPPKPSQPAASSAHSMGPVRLALGKLPSGVTGCPTLWFLKRTAGELLAAEDIEVNMDWGFWPHGPTLEELEKAVAEVYLPLLQSEAAQWSSAGKGPNNEAGQQPQVVAMAKAVNGLAKFHSEIQDTMQQLRDSVRLEMPQGPFEAARLATDEDLLSSLEHTIEGWSEAITNLLQKEADVKPASQDPLSEIAFWRARKASYCGLFEQLCTPEAQSLIQGVKEASQDRNLLNGFNNLYVDLRKLTDEARDNVKFLGTLEHHLQIISGDATSAAIDAPAASLRAVADTLSPLMAALRLVWVLSRHYSDDARMGSLLQRIGAQICSRVEAVVSLGGIFETPVEKALELLHAARGALDSWQATYTQVRKDIETQGTAARWEFNRTLLFESSGHIAGVCADLAGMLVTLRDMRQFVGPELKAVTGEAIDAVIQQVDEMEAAVASLKWPVLQKSYASDWALVRKEFGRAEEAASKAMHEVVDACFRKLKSADAACELLDSFSRMSGHEAIRRQMLAKFDTIVHQFAREMYAAADTFSAQKASPQLAKNMPPVAGAVAWSRSLFARCKKTMTRLLELQPSLSSSILGTQINKQYREFARALLSYEEALATAWRERVEGILEKGLKQPLLREAPGNRRLELNWRYEVDEAFLEAVALDRLGLSVPSQARTAALMVPQLRKHQEGLIAMIDHYHKALDELSAVEREMLNSRLATLKLTLEPGFIRFSWVSLNIPSFTEAAEKAVAEFQALVSQLHKHSSSIQHAIAAIAAAKVFPDLPTDPRAPVPTLNELFDKVEEHKIQVEESMVQRYSAIPPLLCSIEDLIYGTSSGKAPAMAHYYAHWEHLVFGAIHTAVLRGLRRLQELLNPRARAGERPRDLPPLFQVKLLLVASEVVSNPTAADIKKGFTRLARSVAEAAKALVRWMDGACILAPPLPGPTDDDEPFIYTFFGDLGHSSAVVKSVLNITQSASRVAAAVAKAIEQWRAHAHVWKADKEAAVDKFQVDKPGTAAWDQRLYRYASLAADVALQPAASDVDCARVIASRLVAAIRTEANGWVKAFSEAMRQVDQQALQELELAISSARAAAKKHPVTITTVTAEDSKRIGDKARKVEAQANIATTVIIAERQNQRPSNFAALELQAADLEERARIRIQYAAEADAASLQADLNRVRAVTAVLLG